MILHTQVLLHLYLISIFLDYLFTHKYKIQNRKKPFRTIEKGHQRGDCLVKVEEES